MSCIISIYVHKADKAQTVDPIAIKAMVISSKNPIY